MGIELCLGTVVQSGGGALGLAVQRGVVQSGGGPCVLARGGSCLKAVLRLCLMPGGSSAARWPVIAREAMADWVGR